jgi:hypothetical protein
MSDSNPTRRPPSTFLLDHGSIGYQSMRSSIDDRWVEVVLEDDEVEVTLVTTPAKMLALGLSIAGMVAGHTVEDGERVDTALDRIEQLVGKVTAQVAEITQRLADQ